MEGGEFKQPLNKRNLKKLNKESAVLSEVGSNISLISNKTSGGNIKRHCELCGFKLITNWTKHKNDVHAGKEVSYVKCLISCSKCGKSKYLILWEITNL